MNRNTSYTKKQRDTLRNAVMDAMDILGCATQDEFAEKIEVNNSTPGFWLRGERGVSIPLALRIEKMTKGKVKMQRLVPILQEQK